MPRTREAERQEHWRLADELLELARVDTAYADLYLQRGRELLAADLSEAQFAALKDMDAEVPILQNRIANAMEIGEWRQVQEITARLSDLKRTLAERQGARGVGERVYGPFEPLVDAFSPGIQGLAGVPEQNLGAHRDQGVRRLERLGAADPDWKELYEARRRALAALKLGGGAVSSTPGASGPTAADLRAQAQAALASGDLPRLQRLAGEITAAEAAAGAGRSSAGPSTAVEAPRDLDHAFDERALAGARKLGLAPCRVPSTFETVRERFRPSWRPTVSTDASGNTLRLSVTMPADAPEALRDSLEMLINRPFVTSAGTRYVPRFVAEDLLLEDFDEENPESAPKALLDALGLSTRKGLSRRVIEQALRARGGAVVASLGLDPRAFRLVCIPLDVYTRVGAARGWGKREGWTHYDGYVATKDRKLMALVGGDVRFGGLHDLVAVGADYDSGRLLTRLAVVQRQRFATW